ncbi:restriction endonuclease subunit S [Sinorhizobium meliloti]|uniref:restriction endonuclease subunit S n=1 Tax=Rhizobium meliloti TaxID=382 RepID=UPI003D6629CA
MSGLPRGWVESSVDEVGDISSGFGFPDRFQGNVTGELPFAKVRDISQAHQRNGGILSGAGNYVSRADLNALKARTVPAGSVAFAKIGEALKLNRRVLLDVEAVLDNNCMAVTPHQGLVEPKFLYRFLTTLDFAPFSVATTVPSIRKGDVGSIRLPLPPLAEQKRIVTKLDALNAKSARARTELARIETLVSRYKQAVLSKAFSGELTREWRQDGEWPAFVRLGNVAGSFAYGSAAKSQKSGSIPVLRMGNIQNGKLDWADLVYTDDKDEIKKYRLIPGDVLFNRTNSPALVGKTAMYNGERDAIFAGYLIRIVAGPHLDARYLTYALNSPSGREFSWSAKTDGVSQSNISASKLKEFAFAVPPLEEQHEIVRRIESAFARIDRLAKEAKRALELVGRLDEAILAKAFRGELVPQDESDEPAEHLLARIRAEREAAPKGKRGRGR